MPVDVSQLTPVEFTLPSGVEVLMRPLVTDDRDDLAEGFGRLSEVSRYRRFMTPTARLTQRELTYLSELDYRDHFAWGLQVVTDQGLDGAGVARYVRLSHNRLAADTAFTVLDEYQGMGMGQVLFRALAIAGQVSSVKRFHFDVLADNRPMLGILAKFDVTMDPVSGGLSHGELEVGPFVAGLDSWPPGPALKSLAEGVQRMPRRV
jgi:GNAT superfamily N-acetyltransferase